MRDVPVGASHLLALPQGPEAARYDAAEDRLVVAVLALGDGRLSRLAARQRAARGAALAAARVALRDFVDRHLAAARLSPAATAQVHRALGRGIGVVGTRPLVDGSAIVVVAVPAARLRSASPVMGAPWQR